MFIKEYKNKNYKKIELRQGIDGSGNAIYCLHTDRIYNGKLIPYVEWFTTIAEADAWVNCMI